MPSTIPALPFYLLAAAIVGGGVMTLFSRNVVHAAFWLLEVMVAVSGLFLLLSAEFIALVQLLVYAGAVAVLTLFTVMLTLRRREDALRPLDTSLAAAGLAIVFGIVTVISIGGFAPVVAKMPAAAPGIAQFGSELFTRWALPFEVASVVLLIALVGAVWWSGEDEDR
jgi:NADH-quinone oxidoreductase subunit J